MSEENERTEKPTPPPLRDVKDGAVPKRRGRPPKARPIEPVKLPDGVVKAVDLPVHIPACDIPQPLTYENLEKAVGEMEKQAAEDGSHGTITGLVSLRQVTPLLTLHLRRVGAEITDGGGTVHIPASGAIPDGTQLVAHFYREE